MKEFDKVIGYNAIKIELERICDWMNNPEKYQKLGVSLPGGLLLHGEPGVGKTLLANCFIDASKRKSYLCKKNAPNGDFVKSIKKIFEEASDNAPSIVVLDDLDKFANEDADHRNAEEFITIQSCIDDIKGKNVFVLATANDLRNLPCSLLRAGRFDKRIQVNSPTGEDCVRIVKYYLSQKKNVKDVNAREIARILNGRSCAELETVVNEAGIHAGFENKEYIEMNDIIKACMRVVFNAPEIIDRDEDFFNDENKSNNDNGDVHDQYKNNEIITAYHEAGHAVVAELLEPQSVNLVSISRYDGDAGGVTSYYQPPEYWQEKTHMENRVISLLAGKASTELFSGNTDVGANSDIHRAFDIVERFIDNYCSSGFDKFVFNHNSSNELLSRRENLVYSEMERYFQKAKKLLIDNREFLDNIAKELIEKKTIISHDIKDIKIQCKIKS